MDREMIHRDRDKLIDKYVRDELSDQEREIFEEHLLGCSECMNEIKERNKIISSIEKISAKDTFEKRRNPRVWYIAVAAAAGVALVVGLFLLPNRDQPSHLFQEAVQESELDSTEGSGSLKDQIAAGDKIAGDKIAGDKIAGDKTAEEDFQATQGQRLAYQDEFQVNPVYESQIGIHTRAGHLEVESPSDSVLCKPGSFLEFRYHGAQSDSLYLVVLDNQGEILIEEKIASPHKHHMQFPAGLYYWQLTSEEESMHTAKIYIR